MTPIQPFVLSRLKPISLLLLRAGTGMLVAVWGLLRLLSEAGPGLAQRYYSGLFDGQALQLGYGGAQIVIGLLALPVSVLPFVAYAQFTPEGGLLAAKIQVAVAPPQLPEYAAAEEADMRAEAPRWSGRVAVLVYHGMGATSAEQSGTMTIEHFADQIGTLRASGMNPVTAADLAAARNGDAELPDNAVLVTFDDGRTDAFLWADPVLEAADWKATMFLISAEAAKTSLYYEAWDEVAALAGTGR